VNSKQWHKPARSLSDVYRLLHFLEQQDQTLFLQRQYRLLLSAFARIQLRDMTHSGLAMPPQVVSTMEKVLTTIEDSQLPIVVSAPSVALGAYSLSPRIPDLLYASVEFLRNYSANIDERPSGERQNEPQARACTLVHTVRRLVSSYAPEVNFRLALSWYRSAIATSTSARSPYWKKLSIELSTVIRDLFGDPFASTILDGLPPSSPEAACYTALRTPLAQEMVQTILQRRVGPCSRLDSARLQVLADVLEDSDCQNTALLSHLRSRDSFHVSGCWAVELVRGSVSVIPAFTPSKRQKRSTR
jgi:hypothetical protein